VLKLRQLLVGCPEYGANEQGLPRSDSNQVRYIRISDIDEHGNLVQGLGATVAKADPKYAVDYNDILIARSGNTVGKSYIHKEVNGRYIYAGYLLRLKVDSRKADPEYIFYYLQLPVFKKWVFTTQRVTGQPNINAREYSSLQIPVPCPVVQKQVVSIMNSAYEQKKEKETEAQRLLDSIDDYFLQELGISLPLGDSNTIKGRMFKKEWSELTGGRWDCSANSTSFSFTKSRYSIVPFSNAVRINPPTKIFSIDKTTQVTFIPMEAVSDWLGIVTSDLTRPFFEKTGYTLFQEGDIIWAKITPCMQNGKSAVVIGLTNGIGFGSTEFHVFRPTSLVRAEYIHAIVRLRALRLQATRWFSGSAGQQRVDATFFRKLSIPVPPLGIQDAITDEIENLRTKAIQLRQQADDIIKSAKEKVEKLILGV